MLGLENPEEILMILDRYTALKQKEIPKELDEYLGFVARTGDPVYNWSTVQYLFREKLASVIRDFHDTTPSIEDLPPCPNVDAFNYENLKTALVERLDLFHAAPFTVQRLCELLTNPKKHYCRLDKFMRALEKTILVVSTVEPGRKKSESENGDSHSLDVSLDSEHDREVMLPAAADDQADASSSGVAAIKVAVDTVAAVASVDAARSAILAAAEPMDDCDVGAETEAAADGNDDIEVKDSVVVEQPSSAVIVQKSEENAAAVAVDAVEIVIANGQQPKPVVEAMIENGDGDKDVHIDVEDEKPSSAAVEVTNGHHVVDEPETVAKVQSTKQKTDIDETVAETATATLNEDIAAVESSTTESAATSDVAAVALSAVAESAEATAAVDGPADVATERAAEEPAQQQQPSSGKHGLSDDDDDDADKECGANPAKIARMDEDTVPQSSGNASSEVDATTQNVASAAAAAAVPQVIVDVQTSECSSTTETATPMVSSVTMADEAVSSAEASSVSESLTAAPIVEEPSAADSAPENAMPSDSSAVSTAAVTTAGNVVISEVSEAEAVALGETTNNSESSPIVSEPDSSSPKEMDADAEAVVVSSLDTVKDLSSAEASAPSSSAEASSENSDNSAAIVETVAAAIAANEVEENAKPQLEEVAITTSNTVETASTPKATDKDQVPVTSDAAAIVADTVRTEAAISDTAADAVSETSATDKQAAVITEQMAVEEESVDTAATVASSEDISDKEPIAVVAVGDAESTDMEATPIIPGADRAAGATTDAAVAAAAAAPMDVDESNSADSMDI